MVVFPKPPRIRITPNEVNVNRNANDPADINPDLSWGKVIWKNILSLLAPRVWAACSDSKSIMGHVLVNVRTTIEVLKKICATIIPKALPCRFNGVPSSFSSSFTEMNADATTTVGITKGMKVKPSRSRLNLNSDFTNTLDMHSPIATDKAAETVACHIVNQSALRTDTEVKVCSKEERLNPIDSIFPMG
tara:strand:- start:1242 stop:1811 length:570 start_codon:yes stop_codon:yes gene_type:complete